MQPAPRGEHLEIALTLWKISAIATPLLALISFRFLPIEFYWLFICLIFVIFVQPLWFFLLWAILPTQSVIYFTEFFQNIVLLLIFLFFFYKKLPTLAQVTRISILSQALFSIFLFLI